MELWSGGTSSGAVKQIAELWSDETASGAEEL